MQDRITIHRNLCTEINELYANKNADYGDSFAITRRRVPHAILVRLWDKLLRLDTIMTKGVQHVSDETIDDTLLDLANYCLMELTERNVDKQSSAQQASVRAKTHS